MCGDWWELGGWDSGTELWREARKRVFILSSGNGAVIEAVNKRGHRGKIMHLVRDLLSLEFLWNTIHL